MLHYALTLEEARQAKAATGGNGWIDAGDFRDLPARAALCRTGDGHAKVIRDWSRVDCPACIAIHTDQPALIETTERASYWRLPRGGYQATKPGAPPPTGEGGYFVLYELKRLKGD